MLKKILTPRVGYTMSLFLKENKGETCLVSAGYKLNLP